MNEGKKCYFCRHRAADREMGCQGTAVYVCDSLDCHQDNQGRVRSPNVGVQYVRIASPRVHIES